MIKKKNIDRIEIFHILLLVVGAVTFAASACFSSVWFDEAYTVGAVSNGFRDMIRGLTYDVHPHLYYIVLKLWSFIFGNSVIALRMFSAVFGVAAASIGYTHIRKDFGEEVGFWFSFLMIFSFSTLKYATQVRMYTFGIYLLALTAVYAWRYINGKSRKDRTLFLVFSILSAYTHYFAFFIVSMLNVFTLVRAIISDNRAENLKSWSFDALIQFGGYSVGLAVFIYQITLGGAYWITVEYPDVIFDTVVHTFTAAPLSEEFESGSLIYNLIGIVLTAVYAATFGKLAFRYKNEKSEYKAPFMSMSLCIALFIFMLVFAVIRPIYYQRYSVLFTGFLVFSAAFLLTKAKIKLVKAFVAIILVVCFLVAAIPFWKDNFSADNEPFAEQIGIREGDILIGDNTHYLVCTIEMPNNSFVFYNWDNWPVEKAYTLFGDNLSVKDDLSEFSEHEGRIWVCGEKTTEFFDNCENAEFISEKQTHADYYNYNLTFRLYEIKAK